MTLTSIASTGYSAEALPAWRCGNPADAVLCAPPAGADLEASFFCGDAAGEEGDALDAPSDRDFAAAAGLPFKTPKEVFGCGVPFCAPLSPLSRSPLVAAGR